LSLKRTIRRTGSRASGLTPRCCAVEAHRRPPPAAASPDQSGVPLTLHPAGEHRPRAGPDPIPQRLAYRAAAVDIAIGPVGRVGVVALAPDDDRGPLRGLSPGALPYHIRELSPLFTLRIVEARGL